MSARPEEKRWWSGDPDWDAGVCDGEGTRWFDPAKASGVGCPRCPRCRPCTACHGSGDEQYEERPGRYWLRDCPRCHGSGVEPEVCPDCGSEESAWRRMVYSGPESWLCTNSAFHSPDPASDPNQSAEDASDRASAKAESGRAKAARRWDAT